MCQNICLWYKLNFEFDFFSETWQSYEESYTTVGKACVNIDDVFDFCPKKEFPLSKDNQGYQGYAEKLSKKCQMDELRQSAVFQSVWGLVSRNPWVGQWRCFCRGICRLLS